jgi:ATP-dependent HslUV protease ATP-binding subunit HslU
VQKQAEKNAEERLLDLLLPKRSSAPEGEDEGTTRSKLREKLREGSLDAREVEVVVEERQMPFMQLFTDAGMEELGVDMGSMFGGTPKRATKRVNVKDARRIITQQEAEKLIDREKAVQEGVRRAQEAGVIFIDEIDKIVSAGKSSSGPDVSREGVQRDLLPIVEGATIQTRYGPVKTDHVLFIAAGAFSTSRPTDLIPELQGRFPLRAELKSLTRDDFVRILTEPKNAITKQYRLLLETEKVKIDFAPDAIEEMASIAFQLNSTMQDIGARRLHTIIEKVLDDFSFQAPDIAPCQFTVNAQYVRDRLKDIMASEDLRKYIL